MHKEAFLWGLRSLPTQPVWLGDLGTEGQVSGANDPVLVVSPFISCPGKQSLALPCRSPPIPHPHGPYQPRMAESLPSRMVAWRPLKGTFLCHRLPSPSANPPVVWEPHEVPRRLAELRPMLGDTSRAQARSSWVQHRGSLRVGAA